MFESSFMSMRDHVSEVHNMTSVPLKTGKESRAVPVRLTVQLEGSIRQAVEQAIRLTQAIALNCEFVLIVRRATSICRSCARNGRLCVVDFRE